VLAGRFASCCIIALITSELTVVEHIGGHVQNHHGADDEAFPQAEGLALAASILTLPPSTRPTKAGAMTSSPRIAR